MIQMEWQVILWDEEEKNGQTDSSIGLGKITEQKGILGPGPAELRFPEAIWPDGVDIGWLFWILKDRDRRGVSFQSSPGVKLLYPSFCCKMDRCFVLVDWLDIYRIDPFWELANINVLINHEFFLNFWMRGS